MIPSSRWLPPKFRGKTPKERAQSAWRYISEISDDKPFRSLETLDLTGAEMSRNQAVILARQLHHLRPILENLIFANGAFEDDVAMTAFLEVWSNGVYSWYCIHHLDLSKNNHKLTTEGATFLGKMLGDNLGLLDSLLLDGNNSMGEEGLYLILEGLADRARDILPPRRLSKLTLPAGVVRGRGFDGLFLALWSGRIDLLEELWLELDLLEGDPANCRGLIYYAEQGGPQDMAALQSRFYRERPVGDVEMSHLVGALVRFKELKNLQFGWTGIGDVSGAYIAKNFQRGAWDGLEVCDVSGSSPGGMWVMELANALRSRPDLALRTLKLSCSVLVALKALAEALAAGACPKLELLLVDAVRDISIEDLTVGEDCLMNAVQHRQPKVDVKVQRGGHHPKDFQEFVEDYGMRASIRRWEGKEE